MKIYIAIPVWGEHFVATFLNYALPTLMTPDNLPYLARAGEAEFAIYTDRESVALLRDAPGIRALEALMPVSYNFIETAAVNSKWTAVRESNRRMIEAADEREAVLITLGPDSLWSNECLRRAYETIERGYSVYMVPGYRTIYERMTEAADSIRNPAAPTVLDMPAEALIRLGHQHIHPEMRTWYWDDPTYAFAATYISFDVTDQGTVAFCYNAHPLALRAQKRGVPLRRIFDQDYLGESCPDFSRHYMVTDAREGIFYEMSSQDMPYFQRPRGLRSSLLRTAWYREYWYVPARKYYPQFPVRLPYALDDEASWRAAEERGRRIIRRLEFLNSLPDIVLVFCLPIQLMRRSLRRTRRDNDGIPIWDGLIQSTGTVLAAFCLPFAHARDFFLVRMRRTVQFARFWANWYRTTPDSYRRILRRFRRRILR